MGTYRLGTRGSKLALWQAEHVRAQLSADVELVTISTTGDKRMDVPLQSIGDKSLFIKEIEEALLDERIDFAVHSLKDVPSRLDERFVLAAVLERADPRDVLLTRDGGGLDSVPGGGRVGSSSLRREVQLRAGRPDLRFEPIRGNVDTRLRKLEDGEYDAIVLAAAGLNRLGVRVPGRAYVAPSTCLPAAGQAVICVEALASRNDLGELLRELEHPLTRQCVEAERTFAAALDAGCRVPVAAYACPADDDALQLQVLVASVDGSRRIRLSGEGMEAVELGQRLASQAFEQGAADILAP